jgi:phosphorylcholine metabolism protein LicD
MQSDVCIRYYMPFSIDPLEGKDVQSVLDDGIKQITAKHWISSGTLLGLYRDKGFIPHDTDIDVNVLDSAEIELRGFDLIRKMWHQDRIMQTAFIKDTVIFDIYYFYSDSKPQFAVNYNEYGVIEKPLGFLTDLDSLEFNGQSYPTPHDIPMFLNWRFSDWQTPKKNKDSWELDATHIKNYT